MPDFWLEVSFHPEGPATDQLDQIFPWLSSVLEQMLSWDSNFPLQCMFHMQSSKRCYQNFRSNVALTMLDYISVQKSENTAVGIRHTDDVAPSN
jgi:hypothetical protein